MKPPLPRCTGTRLYCDLPLSPGAEIVLPETAARHAVTVLRLQVGDTLNLFNGAGGEYSAQPRRREQARNQGAPDRVPRRPNANRRSRSRWRWASRPVSAWTTACKRPPNSVSPRFMPLATERSVVKLAGERADKRLQHWQHVVIAACEQCGRNRVPAVAPVQKLYAYLAAVDRSERRLLLSPDAATPLKRVAPATSVVLLIGAEGGFAPAEYAGGRSERIRAGQPGAAHPAHGDRAGRGAGGAAGAVGGWLGFPPRARPAQGR